MKFSAKIGNISPSSGFFPKNHACFQFAVHVRAQLPEKLQHFSHPARGVAVFLLWKQDERKTEGSLMARRWLEDDSEMGASPLGGRSSAPNLDSFVRFRVFCRFAASRGGSDPRNHCCSCCSSKTGRLLSARFETADAVDDTLYIRLE